MSGIQDFEFEEILAKEATYVDATYITIRNSVARLTFCEKGQPGREPTARAAVVMSLADLAGLRDMIDRMLPKPPPKEEQH